MHLQHVQTTQQPQQQQIQVMTMTTMTTNANTTNSTCHHSALYRTLHNVYQQKLRIASNTMWPTADLLCGRPYDP